MNTPNENEPSTVEWEIIQDKALRWDTDEIIQRVKALPPSRERALAITKLQEGVMWLGMDLKRIHETMPAAGGVGREFTAEEMAEAGYRRYGMVTGFKNFQGNPMPLWEALPEQIKGAWIAAILQPPVCAANPYPNGKDPSNTKIDPTADGLKL